MLMINSPSNPTIYRAEKNPKTIAAKINEFYTLIEKKKLNEALKLGELIQMVLDSNPKTGEKYSIKIDLFKIRMQVHRAKAQQLLQLMAAEVKEKNKTQVRLHFSELEQIAKLYPIKSNLQKEIERPLRKYRKWLHVYEDLVKDKNTNLTKEQIKSSKYSSDMQNHRFEKIKNVYHYLKNTIIKTTYRNYVQLEHAQIMPKSKNGEPHSLLESREEQNFNFRIFLLNNRAKKGIFWGGMIGIAAFILGSLGLLYCSLIVMMIIVFGYIMIRKRIIKEIRYALLREEYKLKRQSQEIIKSLIEKPINPTATTKIIRKPKPINDSLIDFLKD